MGISASSAIKFFKDSGTIIGENRKKKLTLRNGKLLLEKLKAECDCRSDLFTIFSAKELKNATNDYAEKLYSDSGFGLYKGYLKGRGLPVLVKHYGGNDSDRNIEQAISDVILLEEKFHATWAMVERVRGSPPQWSPDLSPLSRLVAQSPPQSPPDLSPPSRLFYTSETAPPRAVTANVALSELPQAVPDEDHLWKEVIRAGFMTKKAFGANYQQFMGCGELALQCRRYDSHQRPTMMEVALELRRIINFQTSTLRK
ncbi:hypothetical protein RJ641_019599 [Dillenia turbinata]|uniref:Uncharacterized protein n=1 Tax=Dillenia turbinata TaxID=194707 RepID=A0AAN8UVM9_9MAGN